MSLPLLFGCSVQPERQPGGFTLIKTQYLDPAHGWKALSDYDGDFEAVATAARKALKRWQTELDCKAVHGDLRTPNIFARCVARGCPSQPCCCIPLEQAW